MSDALIWLDQVHFQYAPDRVVLAQCSLRVQAGERIGLTGPVGSGKTSLLRLIVGLARPTKGRVEVFGRARTRESDYQEVRRRVGFLFQDVDDQLFCPTVAEDVAFGPLNLDLPRGEVRQIVTQTLADLGLAGYENRVTYQLSGGEKRLVALAGVLAMRPDVLLLDEPTAELDGVAADRVLDVLLTLPQAMIIVSHDPSHLARIATRHVRLAEGKLLSV